MAKAKSITEGLQYRAIWWCDEWRGTAAELIAAGIVERHLLPGEPGNNKISASYVCGVLVSKGKNPKKNENYLSIARSGKLFYVVQKGISDEERLKRRSAEEEQRKQWQEEHKYQREIAQKKEYCAFEISGLIDREDIYRDRICSHIGVISHYASGHQGYRFSHSAFTKINDHINAIYALIESEQVIFDKQERAKEIQKIYEKYELEPPEQEKKTPVLRLVK